MSAVRAWARALRRRRDDEQGQLLVMTVIFMTMFLAFMGLVVDGGSYLNAKDAAATEALSSALA